MHALLVFTGNLYGGTTNIHYLQSATTRCIRRSLLSKDWAILYYLTMSSQRKKITPASDHDQCNVQKSTSAPSQRPPRKMVYVLLITLMMCLSFHLGGRVNQSQLLQPLLRSTSLEAKEEQIGIVVGHCKEDIRYLDDFGSCDRIQIHIYSPCGGEIPEFKKVQECVTVHRGKDCARETYAYFEFVREYYDSLPSMVAFLQGSAITENPHVVNDVLNYMPGTTYSSLSRIVRSAWHMKHDPLRVDMQSRMTPGLSEQGTWMTGWRSQFMASRETLRNVPKSAYEELIGHFCNQTCVHVQCTMETWLGPLMNCAPHLFRGDNCSTHTHKLALAAVEADYSKDGSPTGPLATKITQTVCGDRTILYSESFYNGMFFCGEGDYSSARAWLDTVAVPAEQNKDAAALLEKFQAAKKAQQEESKRLKKLQEEGRK
jgi:hypothetical protein